MGEQHAKRATSLLPMRTQKSRAMVKNHGTALGE
jgi:hypothetical protein